MAHELKRLDVESTKVQTRYCISQEKREEQMLVANHRIKDRLEPTEAIHDEEIAIVCYGPSLMDTWQDLRSFKKIITCSGAHKFLLDRGIVPTWHVDLDPREHKVRMLGQPHPGVEYLIASCCHPAMWDLLEGHKVKLWHIYANEDNRELPLTYPRGDWILTGGNNVGLRCLVVARILGYRNMHVYGMDCSFHDKAKHHAAKHLNANKQIYEVPYGGKMYYCEPVMVDYARQFFHEMQQLPDVSVTLHGEGLLQHMASVKRHEKVKIKESVKIAFSTPITATPEHVAACKKLHLDPIYGIYGKRRKDLVLKLSEAMKTKNILDYGCGKGMLAASLPFPVWEYDPAIPGKDGVPRPADLVLCIDVLSHVEPDMLENVLGDLVRCSRICVFAVIDMANGLIQHDKDWWYEKLNAFFKIGTLLQHGTELHCVIEPRPMGPRSV